MRQLISSSQRSFQKGFTLIELLVVVSIIALLVSILLPALNKARIQAKEVVCMNQVHQIVLGLLMAADENNGKFYKREFYDPRYATYIYNSASEEERQERDKFMDLLVNKIAFENDSILWCPFLKESPKDSPWYGETDWSRALHYLHDGREVYFMGYALYAGLEHYLLDWTYANNAQGNTLKYGFGPKKTGSGRDAILSDFNSYYRNYPYNGISQYNSAHSNPTRGEINNQDEYPYFEEFVSTNTGYGDGHVEKHTDVSTLNYVTSLSTQYAHLW